MFNYYEPPYLPLTKTQKKNIGDWSNFYQETYHIATFKAERLARKKINKIFSK